MTLAAVQHTAIHQMFRSNGSDPFNKLDEDMHPNQSISNYWERTVLTSSSTVEKNKLLLHADDFCCRGGFVQNIGQVSNASGFIPTVRVTAS